MFHIKHERSLDFLYGAPESPQEHRHKSRETLRSPQQHIRAPCTPNQLKMRPNSPALAPEPSHIPHQTQQSAPCTPNHLVRQLQRFPENTVPSLEEHRVQQSNSRRAPRSPNHLTMRGDSLASTQEECQLSTSTSRGVFSQQ